MARIELRNCTVLMKDGLGANPDVYPCTALANKTLTPGKTPVVQGDTTCKLSSVSIPPAVGGNTEKVPVGARFLIDSETDATQVHVVTGRTQSGAGANAKQSVSLDATTEGAPTGGTFTLAFGGKTTAAIAFDASTADVKAALVAMDDGYTTSEWDVTGDPGAWVVEFKGALGLAPRALLVGDGTSLSGGAGVVKTVTVATTVAGVPAAGSAVTTAITFSPALGAGSYATDAAVTFQPQQIEVKIGDGDIKYSEADAYTYDKDRGELDTVRKGDDTPMDVSMNFTFEHVKTGTSKAITPTDAVKGINGAAEWINSSERRLRAVCRGCRGGIRSALRHGGFGNDPFPRLPQREAGL